jgi:hypothetical protein
MTTEPVTAEAHLAAVADALNPLWRSNGLPLSSTWILEFIELLKDECDEVGQQLDATEADVARLRSGEATPDMIAAGIHVLNASGAIEHPLDANEVLVADIYRAMVRARSRDAAVQACPECLSRAPSFWSRTRATSPYDQLPTRMNRGRNVKRKGRRAALARISVHHPSSALRPASVMR